MAGGGIDAFLYFGRSLKGGKPSQIDGETTDRIEREASGGYGKSMAIQQYTMGFELNTDLTEEHVNESDDKQQHDPTITSITVTKMADAASPYLLAALWQGTQYSDAWISQRKAGGQKGMSGDYFWQIELQEVSISNIQWSASDGGETTETLTLHAAKGIHVYYRKQTHTGELESQKHNFHAAIGTTSTGKKKGPTQLDSTQTQSIVNEVLQRIKAKNPTIKIV
ncbi:MAG TPA: type VI secretion system tube protein Hcp [Stellaceae bacterium]|jgi:type VI protein secretion system component Hcp|nr:type VI secretion system tube protein Hcp [Stellaceae bacterium]